eukprot:3634965-Prymnesium_polylepis.1
MISAEPCESDAPGECRPETEEEAAAGMFDTSVEEQLTEADNDSADVEPAVQDGFRWVIQD